MNTDSPQHGQKCNQESVSQSSSPKNTESSGSIKKLPRRFLGSTGEGTCTIQVSEQLAINNSLDEILVFARHKQASDIHLSVNNPIVFRIFGTLQAQTEEKLTCETIRNIISSALTQEQISKFLDKGDLELIYTIEGAGRFRVTLVKQRLGWDFTARVIPLTIMSFEESGMPSSCLDLTKWAQGFVLVTGPTGCGKTTTLSTLVELINQTRDEHIITIENPIEMAFTPKRCQITQREVDLHTLSQDNALRGALREDPDILVISELRDLSSIQLAVTAAETGHLVLGTMNTNDASQTLIRIINSFPPEEQSNMQSMISESLRGIICQQLIPRKDGNGVVPAYEVLIVNAAVSGLVRKGKYNQLTSVMTTSKADGMLLFDNSLKQLMHEDIISVEEAYRRAINPEEFKQYCYDDNGNPLL